jgi:hypothetical protein
MSFVMLGLPGIHVFIQFAASKTWMGRVKPGQTNCYQLLGTAGADVGGGASGGAFFGFSVPA